MWLSRYFVLFIIFGFMGWIYETLYCTIKNKKWDNRGFLYGPMLPIYGTGAVLATIVVDLVSGVVVSYEYSWWQVFLVAFFGSIVLEYSTSWGLEKLFHAYWWDYSNVPLNINGRVCFPASCGFGFAGILVVYVILPYTEKATAWITPIEYEFFALILMGLISIDTTLTVSALTNFAKNVEAFEKALDVHMEQFVLDFSEGKITPASILSEGKELAGATLASGKELAGATLASGKEFAGNKLADGKQAAVARIEGGKQSMEERILAEREKFSRENMEQMLSGFGNGSKAALSRVQGFRPRLKNDSNEENAKRFGRFNKMHTLHMNNGLKILKDRRRDKKNTTK